MSGRRQIPDVDRMIVVPARPGPLVRLADVERGHDDVDGVIDELFGAADERGPGIADAVLVVGGGGAALVGLTTGAPTLVTVLGIAALGLGAVLPLRSLWGGIRGRRKSARQRSMIGDGVLLRVDHPSTRRLADSYERVVAASGALATTPRARVDAVAHSAVLEVASLLDSRSPTGDAELEYVTARCVALDDLARVVTDPRVGDGESDRRRALVDARREVDELSGGSSISAAADLTRELLGDAGT